MVWIKRNLVLVVSGLVGLALCGFGIYLVLGGLTRNKQLSEEVENTRSRANQLYDANPFPSRTNIDMAKKEADELHAAIAKAHKHLAPVKLEKMDIKQFTVWRDETINELRNAAKRSGTDLPVENYSFSFATQRAKTQFSADTLPHVAEQMAEVKALCAMLFEARVNKIGNIRRARVSEDDRNSSFGSDYTVIGVMPDPQGHMASNPYEVTFHSFSAEIADVVNRLERSPHGFLVKAIQVEPEDSKMADAGGPMVAQNLPGSENRPTPQPPPGRPRFAQPPTTTPVRPATPPPVAPKPTANDRPVTLLKEKRLKATMLVYALKPASK